MKPILYESLKRAFLAAFESASIPYLYLYAQEYVESIGESPSAPELAKSSIRFRNPFFFKERRLQ